MSAHHTAVEPTAPPYAHQAPHVAGPDLGEGRRPWTVFALMIAAQFMVILDVSVVNVALPSISHGLHLTASDYQWVISAYVLMSGGLLLLGGRIADLLDRRRAFLVGIITFTCASLVSGLAQTPLTLIASRAAQGAGAALLTPAALSIIVTAYAGRQRQKALAIWGAIGSTGIAAGVLFGGGLTSALGWRAVYFINWRIGHGSSTAPAVRAPVPWRTSSACMVRRIARLRSSPSGKRSRCSCRCPSTCRSVSTTKPRLTRSPKLPARAPMAKDPAYHSGFNRLGREPSSDRRSSHQARWSVSSRPARNSRA